jgi:hypothetical protein
MSTESSSPDHPGIGGSMLVGTTATSAWRIVEQQAVSESATRPLVDFGVLNDNLIK